MPTISIEVATCLPSEFSHASMRKLDIIPDVATVDLTFNWLNTLFQKDISKGLAGFLFTSGIAAIVSMSYNPLNPATLPGRSYLDIFSLFALYNSVKDFHVVAPVQEKRTNQIQVR